MLKTLLYLDENLASSIALRFVDYLSGLIPMEPTIIHVVEPEDKQTAGTGWVRRTWEAGMMESGMMTVSRLLKTEKVKCRFAGQPMVVVGDREKEVLEALNVHGYDLYIEGVLPTAGAADFHHLMESDLYRRSPAPILCVKNLSISTTAAILLGDGVDHSMLISRVASLLKGSKIGVELYYYIYREDGEVMLLGKEEGGASMIEAEATLEKNGLKPIRSAALSGAPEQVGDYLKDYVFIASALPPRRTMASEVLGNTPASVLLCRK